MTTDTEVATDRAAALEAELLKTSDWLDERAANLEGLDAERGVSRAAREVARIEAVKLRGRARLLRFVVASEGVPS
jgi:hypothetical protein